MLCRRSGISKTVTAIVAVVFIAAAGIGVYFASAPASLQPPATTQATAQTTAAGTTSSAARSSASPPTSSGTSTVPLTTNPSSTPTTSSVASTVSTASCAVTSTSLPQPASAIVPLLNAYASLTQRVQGSANGTSFDITASYHVIYATQATFKIGVSEVQAGQNNSATVWLQRDGSILAMELAGHNFTGATAAGYFQAYLGLWEEELMYAQQITTATSYSYFHSTGTSTVTIGSSTFTTTSYEADSLPETVQGCSGPALTLTKGSFSAGSPGGSSYPLIVSIEIAGSAGSTTFDFSSQITSVAVT